MKHVLCTSLLMSLLTGCSVSEPAMTRAAPEETETADLNLDVVNLPPYGDSPDQNEFLESPALTQGVIRVRRRHENDMDFSKYNPFYWEGRNTKFTVEDFTKKGEEKIVFTLETEWPQDYIPTRGPDFSAIYSGNPEADSETLRSKFKINARMKHLRDGRVFQAVLGPSEFRTYSELKKGQLLTFEFRFFMAESHPGWKAEKNKNPHTLSAYYSEFFRIRIGESGLLIDNPRDPKAFAPAEAYSGGATTIPTVKVEPWLALQQNALNLRDENNESFLMGRTWFHTDFSSGQHIDDDTDDKPAFFFDDMKAERSGYAGTAFNARTCNGCHVHNGIAMLPEEGKPVDKTIVKTLDAKTGQPHKDFGAQLQTRGNDAEGLLKVKDFETTTVTLKDGTEIELRKPVFTIDDAAFSTDNVALSPRKPAAIIGLGLLEAVPDQTIRDLAAKNKGTVNVVDGKIGRYGWKASQPTLRDQIMAALDSDMGVASSKNKRLGCEPRCEQGPKGAVIDEAVSKMNAYVSLLGVPARRNPGDAKVKRGQTLFRELNCQSCHVENLTTGKSEVPELSNQKIAPFTDLLLHDMGDGLADKAGPLAKKWQTAPLWGLKNVRHAAKALIRDFPAGNINIVWTKPQAAAEKNAVELLHDGRARSIPEAILWHGGEAGESVKKYKDLSKEERDALEAFLWDL